MRIACPADCPFLGTNVEYQHKRIGDRLAQERRRWYQEIATQLGERALEIVYVLEALIFRYFHARRDAQDADVLAGIRSLRQSFSPIHIPESITPAFGEELKKEFKALADRQPLDPNLITAALDRMISFIQTFSGGALGSNRYLQGLIGYVTHQHADVAEQLIKQTGVGDRIIIPTSTTLEDSGQAKIGR
ncbi:MAG: hypothetical protein D6690_16260 [Nitrospirae bacterium]|nr:MAG: hypothetical protein D6690_16260 [Nitrospirota bacterium]